MIGDPPLPDGCFINAQILITSYFDSNGDLKYVVTINGDINIAQVMGLLVLGGIATYQNYSVAYEPDELEDDEDE